MLNIPWLREAPTSLLVAMAETKAEHGVRWARRSAATLARRLRRERLKGSLYACAREAIHQMGLAELHGGVKDTLMQKMADFGAARLDHWALDTFNGTHAHMHGEAICKAAPALNHHLVEDLVATKQRGDAARHSTGPTFRRGTGHNAAFYPTGSACARNSGLRDCEPALDIHVRVRALELALVQQRGVLHDKSSQRTGDLDACSYDDSSQNTHCNPIAGHTLAPGTWRTDKAYHTDAFDGNAGACSNVVPTCDDLQISALRNLLTCLQQSNTPIGQDLASATDSGIRSIVEAAAHPAPDLHEAADDAADTALVCNRIFEYLSVLRPGDGAQSENIDTFSNIVASDVGAHSFTAIDAHDADAVSTHSMSPTGSVDSTTGRNARSTSDAVDAVATVPVLGHGIDNDQHNPNVMSSAFFNSGTTSRDPGHSIVNEHHNLHATSSEFSNTGTTTQGSASAPSSELDMHNDASISTKPLPAKSVTAKSGLKPLGWRLTGRNAIDYLRECRRTGIRADRTRVLGSAAYTKYLCGQPLE